MSSRTMRTRSCQLVFAWAFATLIFVFGGCGGVENEPPSANVQTASPTRSNAPPAPPFQQAPAQASVETTVTANASQTGASETKIIEQIGALVAQRQLPQLPPGVPPTAPLPGGYGKWYTLDQRGNVDAIDLEYTPTTDADLAKIADLPSVGILRLSGTKITDAGLAHLTRMKRLAHLSLGYTAVTDAGLVPLTSMSQLTNLELTHTAVSDASVSQLARMKQLKYLRLAGTQITQEGRKALEQALPGCRVY